MFSQSHIRLHSLSVATQGCCVFPDRAAHVASINNQMACAAQLKMVTRPHPPSGPQS